MKVRPHIVVSALDSVSSHHNQMDLISGEYGLLASSLQFTHTQ